MTRLLNRLMPLTLAMGLAAIAITGITPSSLKPVASVTVNIPVTTWTVINSGQPNNSYWTGSYRDSIRVGKSPADGQVWRGILQADIGSLQGRAIMDARLTITLDHSASCAPTPVQLHQFNGVVDPETAVTWTNSSSAFGQVLDASYATACTGRPDYVIQFGGTAFTTSLGQSVEQTHSTFNVGLRAASETNSMEWKKFYPTSITLSVTYLD